MNIVQKMEWVSDMLGETCFLVDFCTYQKMNEKQKEEVKNMFLSLLKKEKVEITTELIDMAEQKFSLSPLPLFLRIYKYNYQSIFSSAVQELKQGRKVTIFKFSDFGFPVIFNTVIEQVLIEKWAQYNETMKMIHKPKRKRSFYSNRLLPDEKLLVYDGWLEVDIDKLTNNVIKENEYVTVKQSRYGCFDSQYLTDIVNLLNQEPIVKLNIT